MSTEEVKIDLEALMALQVGDIVEVPSLMLGISSEPSILQVVSTTPNKVSFAVSFFGVNICGAALTRTSKGLAWTSKAA